VKGVIYARYSSDNQRDASIADQLRVCREFAARQSWTVVNEFTDHAVSGATLLRSGFQTLMRDALNGRLDVVLAEALDRFSRDQEDTAGLFKRLTFAGVSIVTLAEGDITHLHVGLKGTMNALFLKDLADKTRRGLRGRVEVGKSGGGLCYGYVTSAMYDGVAATGARDIVPAEAESDRPDLPRLCGLPVAKGPREATERGALSGTRWRSLESQHHSRQSCPRHRTPEQ
jgi:site-specific DNA recombinase